MKLRRKDGTRYEMSFTELGARLWPFGKWVIVWKHITEGKQDGPKITNKVTAVKAFQMNQSIGSSAMKCIGIRKVGGRFDGIEYRPTQR